MRLLLAHLSTSDRAVETVLDALDVWSPSKEWTDGAVLVHRVLELAGTGAATEAEWRDALDSALEFAARQDSPYVNRRRDEFDTAPALVVARTTGLIEGFEAAAKPALVA